MRYRVFKIFVFLLVVAKTYAQDTEIDRLVKGELKRTFPSIYFKHNATEYAVKDSRVDSCFKYIALNIKDINDLVIWRDSLETEKLTQQRIKKLKTELRKYKVSGIHIESMGKQQKISRHTIETTADSAQIKYLLSLNSVFEVAKTRLQDKPSVGSHGLWLFGVCCKHAFRLNKNGREHCKMERRIINKSKGK